MFIILALPGHVRAYSVGELECQQTIQGSIEFGMKDLAPVRVRRVALSLVRAPSSSPFNRDFPDDSCQAPKTVAQLSIERNRDHSTRIGGLGWGTRCARDSATAQSGARRRSFGKCEEPSAHRFNPIAAMTQVVMSALASAASRRSVAGSRRVAAVESLPRQAGT